jgi:hypothetical protein
MKINEEELKLAYTNYVIENTTDNAVLYGSFAKKIETDVEFAKQWLPSRLFKANLESEMIRIVKLERDLTRMFDSDVRVGLALLEEIRKIKLD